MRNFENFFQNRQTEICAKISEIVEIESPSRNTEGSRKVAEWIESRTRKNFKRF